MSKCEHCQKSDNRLYTMKGVLQNGQPGEVHLCYECSFKFMQGNEWFYSPNGLIKSAESPVKVNQDNVKKKSKDAETGEGFWTSIVKISNLIVLIALVILGAVAGGVSGEVGMAIIGGLIGLVIGVVIVSMSMLFVEISQKLSILIDEVKKLK